MRYGASGHVAVELYGCGFVSPSRSRILDGAQDFAALQRAFQGQQFFERLIAMNNPQYLGDGAYAEFDGEQVCIFASDGERRTNQVWLEPAVAKNFLRWFCSISPEAVQMMRDVIGEIPA